MIIDNKTFTIIYDDVYNDLSKCTVCIDMNETTKVMSIQLLYNRSVFKLNRYLQKNYKIHLRCYNNSVSFSGVATIENVSVNIDRTTNHSNIILYCTFEYD